MFIKLSRSGILRNAALYALALVIVFPLLFLVLGSLMQSGELARRAGPAVSGDGYATPLLIPEVTTVKSYVKLLIDDPEYLRMFWNSCKIVFPSLIVQLTVGCPAAWAFARYSFPGRKALFRTYITLMLLPFQVTMVPTYIMLSELKLLGGVAGVICSQAFNTFTVFLLYRFFSAIPMTMIEAARIDGAGEVRIFLHIALPLAASGVLSALLLGYIELWNLVEPPMLFLEDASQWPLSLYQTRVSLGKLDVAFAGSVLTLLPPVLLFLFGQTYLEQGIQSMGIKE